MNKERQDRGYQDGDCEAPVDIVYACRNPIVSYYITPESRPNEGGMKGIEEPCPKDERLYLLWVVGI